MNIRRSIIFMVTAFLLGSLLTDGSQSFVFAQSKSETAVSRKNVTELPSKMFDKRANELLSRINDITASLKGYETKIKSASTEDRLVLQLQIQKLRIQIMDDIQKLADVFLDLEKSGTQPRLRG